MPERRDNADHEPGTTTVVEPSPVAAARPASPERAARAAQFAPDAVLVGWLAAWGAATLAAACVREAGVDLGLGLGIASGDPGVEDRLWPGVWMLVIQAGAFAVGGYAAARLARARALLHAGLAWALAMLVTGADAVVIAVREGDSVLARLDLPHWAHTGLSGAWEEGLALAIIALAGLAGALIGGSLAAAVNRGPRRGEQPAAADG